MPERELRRIVNGPISIRKLKFERYTLGEFYGGLRVCMATIPYISRSRRRCAAQTGHASDTPCKALCGVICRYSRTPTHPIVSQPNGNPPPRLNSPHISRVSLNYMVRLTLPMQCREILKVNVLPGFAAVVPFATHTSGQTVLKQLFRLRFLWIVPLFFFLACGRLAWSTNLPDFAYHTMVFCSWPHAQWGMVF